VKQIPLTQGKVTLVDDEDYDALAQYKWHALRSHKTFYAKRWISQKKGKCEYIYMHQQITGKKGSDHHDGDGLNNQKYNLRDATHIQNSQNQGKHTGASKYKGVSRQGPYGWQVMIRVDGKPKYLGFRKVEEDAAKLYDEYALKHFGEFARLNFP
jgi:hypothetical protein